MKTAREVDVNIAGKIFLIASDDDYLDHVKGDFEPYMVDLFQSLAVGSDAILDIGANIGCTAILFGQISKTVHAFEPSSTTFAFLQRNVQMAGMENITSHNFGLGLEAGEFTLTFAPSNRSGGFVSNKTQASNGHTIEKIEIRETDIAIESLNIQKIDFIKIDVEGFEGQVLRGATRTLDKHKPIVALELNHWCLNALQRTSVPEFLDLLRSIFPILLAVDGSTYMNLHNESESYSVMYLHILHMKYLNIIGAFDESQIVKFRSLYRHIAQI
jgi:FkbM family methyltransferase